MQDFNTVAVFSVIDSLQYGYIDHDTIKTFMLKFAPHDDLSKQAIHAVMRRMSTHPDAKITFREFSQAITPEMAGIENSMEFHTEAK